MKHEELPMWAVEISKSSELDETTGKALINKLWGMQQQHQGQPAENQAKLSEQRTATNAELSKILNQASLLAGSLRRLSTNCENAVIHGHGELGRSLSHNSSEWFIRELGVNLQDLQEAASQALEQRQWPQNRPRDFVLRFWIDRIIEAFYHHAPSVNISNKSQSLFFRTAQLYLSALNLSDSDMQRTVKQQIEQHQYLRH